ncbi:MAG: pyridoxamine 5'-phosphate oxidase family protein [Lachnospiraceae bacterium]|nr:pyridoxamine 5'-phosphate oxidase family protein [Lachnospiraceae bacterium]
MEKCYEILKERFCKDSLMALATVDEKGIPWVRTIDAIFYEDSFYTITYALSNKMKQIGHNAAVAISGEWFSGHAIAENLGHIKLEQNKEIADKLRCAFAAWYDNGHTNEEDPNTIILKMRLTDGILFSDGKKYELGGQK